MRPRNLTQQEFEAAREPTPTQPPYAPDWLVHEVQDFGPSERYRYRVIGINLNCQPGEYGYAFMWRVPTLSWRYTWNNGSSTPGSAP